MSNPTALTDRSRASSETLRRASAKAPTPIGERGARPSIAADVIAGVTLAAVAIPECMGYTKIAGTPVVTGLYTILFPIAAFALIGSSRHLVVGADSATAAILFAGLSGLADPGSMHWLALSSAAALLTSSFLIGAAALRLGFLADFLSRTVLVGFLSGVGVSLVLGQLPDILGIEVQAHGFVPHLTATLAQIPHANLPTVLVAGGLIAVIVAAEHLTPRLPGALLGIGTAITAAWMFRLDRVGVAVVGAVHAGLPSISVPGVSAREVVALLPTVASMFLVVTAQSAATSRSFAQKYGERLDENRDLFALAASNAAAGFTGTFVVNGSPTKTAIADAAGARSQLAQFTTAGVVLIVLLVATSLIAWLPSAALAGLVLLIGVNLVDVESLAQIYRFRKITFVVALGTLCAVVVLGVERGIFVAIVLSVLDHLRQEYEPKDAVLSRSDGQLRMLRADPPLETEPGLIVYRFEAPLFFANADRFSARVTELATHAPHPVKWFVFDFVSTGEIDYTGGLALVTTIKKLQEDDIVVALAEIDDVRTPLTSIGVIHQVAPDHIFDSVSTALDAFRRS
jgi:high affinity sulfate transporter 1